MSQTEEQVEEVVKTAMVFGAVNTLVAPLYWFGAKVGGAATLVANAATFLAMHQQGKDERVVGNTINNVNTFFGNGKPVENGFKNTVKGGASIYDEVKEGAEKLVEHVSSPGK